MRVRLTYLRYRCCKYNYFVKLTDALHELVDSWSFNDIDIMVLALNLDRDRKVRLMKDLYHLA